MAEITDEMVDRAASVIFDPPGLQYFPTPEAIAHNRQVIARALAAALEDPDDVRRDPMVEDRIRDAMAEAHAHPGRTVTR